MNNSTHLDRRSKYSIQVIRQALFELLETKSLDEITVVDLCSQADVNRGTFYKYYRDVPDLYDKTEDSLVNEIYALIPEIDVKDFQNQSFFKKILNILADNKEFIYIAQNKEFSNHLAQKLFTFFIPYLQQMLQVRCPTASEQEAALMIEYILGGCIRVVSYWLKNEMRIPIDDIEKDLSTMINLSLSMYQ